MDEFVANNISRNQVFAQTIYDALYYPVNLWYADWRKVDCSRDAVMRWISGFTSDPLALEESDKNFVHTQVKSVLDLLANLPELERRLSVACDTNRLSFADKGRMLDAIPTGISLLKQIPQGNNLNVYQGNYNRSGIPYEASAIQDIQNNQAIWDAFSMIDAFAKSLPQIIGRRPSVDEVLSGVIAARSVTLSLTQLSVPIGARYDNA